jgi:hypothetical protein
VLGNDVWPGTGQTDSDGPGKAPCRYMMILNGLVNAVFHLGLPAIALCASFCITSNSKGVSSPVSR